MPSPRLSVGRIAFLILLASVACSDPMAPEPGTVYVLTDVSGTALPVPWPLGSPAGTDYEVLAAEQIEIADDTLLYHSVWRYFAHTPPSGMTTYSLSHCDKHIPFRYRQVGDTLRLTPLSILQDLGPGVPLLVRGPDLHIPVPTAQVTLDERFRPAPPTRLTCP